LEQEEPRPAAAVVEVPLLFESGMDQVFDHTIAIVADESLRAERASARGHEGVDSRSSRQLTQEEKAQRADFVVENDADIAALESKLSKVLATIGT
jgi:dephospho-CoA kinase